MTKKRANMSIADAVIDFMQLASAGGILLLLAAIVAMLVANSPLSGLYDSLLDTPVAVQVGALSIDKPLLLWINDGLMAVFFFLVGLEIKREVMEGELATFSQIILPGMGALGGMLVPAAIYVWLNWQDQVALDGWAIPVATDIAFALALLGVFGARVPTALKVFLLTLAIFDDLAAIVIIAIFYSGDLSLTALGIGAARTRARCRHEPDGRHASDQLHSTRHRVVDSRAQVGRACHAGRGINRILYSDAGSGREFAVARTRT